MLRYEHWLREQHVAARCPEGQGVLRLPGGNQRRRVRLVRRDKPVQHTRRLPGFAARPGAGTTDATTDVSTPPGISSRGSASCTCGAARSRRAVGGFKARSL